MAWSLLLFVVLTQAVIVRAEFPVGSPIPPPPLAAITFAPFAKLNAPLTCPAVHAGVPLMEPVLPLPEESQAVVPLPSSNFHQATRPERGGVLVPEQLPLPPPPPEVEVPLIGVEP